MSVVSSAHDTQVTVQNALQQVQVEAVPFRHEYMQGLLSENVRKEVLDIVHPLAALLINYVSFATDFPVI